MAPTPTTIKDSENQAFEGAGEKKGLEVWTASTTGEAKLPEL